MRFLNLHSSLCPIYSDADQHWHYIYSEYFLNKSFILKLLWRVLSLVYIIYFYFFIPQKCQTQILLRTNYALVYKSLRITYALVLNFIIFLICDSYHHSKRKPRQCASHISMKSRSRTGENLLFFLKKLLLMWHHLTRDTICHVVIGHNYHIHQHKT